MDEKQHIMSSARSSKFNRETGHKYAYDGPQLLDEFNDAPLSTNNAIQWQVPSSQSSFVYDSADTLVMHSPNKDRALHHSSSSLKAESTTDDLVKEGQDRQSSSTPANLSVPEFPLVTAFNDAPEKSPVKSPTPSQPHCSSDKAEDSSETSDGPSPATNPQSLHSPFQFLANYCDELKQFCSTPPPPGLTVYCCVTRNKRGVERGLYPTYYLHMEQCMSDMLAEKGGSASALSSADKEALLNQAKASLGRKGAFLLAARKRKYSRTSNYLISVDPTDLHREGDSYIAKVRSNTLGTEFTLYEFAECREELVVDRKHHFMQHSRSFRKSLRFNSPNTRSATAHMLTDPPSLNAAGSLRSELAVVVYEQNVFGFKGPRKFTAIVPALSDSSKRIPCTPLSRHDGLLAYGKSALPAPILKLHNKSPAWNEDTHSYVLNFHGRVTQASVKNFQLVRDNDVENIILQFGRVSKDLFTLDFCHPLTALQAFGIVLTSFDSKLVCE